MQRIFHTPEGVRDVYNEECKEKAYLQRRLMQVFTAYGYEQIETPTFEFFEVFSKEVGTIPSRNLYKFFDREGNLTSPLRSPGHVPPIFLRIRRQSVSAIPVIPLSIIPDSGDS